MNYFREESVWRVEVEVKEENFKNGKAADKDEITIEMVRGWG